MERHRRIKVAIAAYAYEIMNESIMTDAEYDRLCLEIMPKLRTGHHELDRFFREEFDPSTGMWVRNHPHRKRLKQLAKYILAMQRKRK